MRKHVLLLSVVLICALPAMGTVRAALQQQEEPPPASGSETALAQSSPKEMAAFQVLVETRDPQQRLALVRQFVASYPESSFRSYPTALQKKKYGSTTLKSFWTR